MDELMFSFEMTSLSSVLHTVVIFSENIWTYLVYLAMNSKSFWEKKSHTLSGVHCMCNKSGENPCANKQTKKILTKQWYNIICQYEDI